MLQEQLQLWVIVFAKSLSSFSKLVCYWALLRWHFHCSRGRSFQWQGGLVTLLCPPLFGTKEDSWWIWWMSYSETTGYVCCCDGHHFINDLSIWIQDMFETYLNSGRANRIAVGTVSKMLALCFFIPKKLGRAPGWRWRDRERESERESRMFIPRSDGPRDIDSSPYHPMRMCEIWSTCLG